jgi:hypothetical protein
MESLFKTGNFVPSLLEALKTSGMPGKKIQVGLEVTEAGKVHIPDRHRLLIAEGKAACAWDAPDLRELFRGDKKPPIMGDYPPPEYDPFFAFIEMHMITVCNALGDKTDQEFLELYSAMRRRPDGRSLGVVHDFLWQVCALLLAMQPLSALEYEAIMGRLVRSARTFSRGLVSRNYIPSLRSVFEQH